MKKTILSILILVILITSTFGIGPIKVIAQETQITEISTPQESGTYGLGDTIEINLVLNDIVNVTGTPSIFMNTGYYALYTGGSGTSTLTFIYTVRADDNKTQLSCASINSLKLNNGTINDYEGNPVSLVLPSASLDKIIYISTEDHILNTDLDIDPVGLSPADILGIAYGNGMYVIVGSQGNIRTSTDLSNWEGHIVSGELNFKDVEYFNGNFYATVGEDSVRCGVWKSSDTFNWTQIKQDPHPMENKDLFLVSNNGILLVYGNHDFADSYKLCVWKSSDGDTWKICELSGGYQDLFTQICPSGSGFLSFTKKYSYASTNGETWSKLTYEGSVSTYAANESGDIEIYNANDNQVNVNTNKKGWKKYQKPKSEYALVAYTQDAKFLLIYGNDIYNSIDGIVWKDIGDLSLGTGTLFAFNTKLFNVNGTIFVDVYHNGDPTDHTLSIIEKPPIQNVYTTKSNGTYLSGNKIDINLKLSDIVDVSGLPSILMNTGNSAVYISGSGSNTLTFNYTVQPNDRIDILECYSVNALSLNNGTINNSEGHLISSLVLPTVDLGKEIKLGLSEDELIRNATEAVENAESTLNRDDFDNAQNLVDQLPDGQTKDDLQNRLNAIEEAIELNEATEAVDIAETSKEQSDVDIARNLVNKLQDGEAKDSLNARLDTIQDAINLTKQIETATDAVEQAEYTKTEEDIDSARNLVEQLPDIPKKTDLLERLDNIVIDESEDPENPGATTEDAIFAVELAESTRLKSDHDKALDLVNKLAESQTKQDLLDRLAAINLIDDEEEETDTTTADAIKAVEYAESTKKLEDYNTALDLVNKLEESQTKDELLNRLSDLKDFIDSQAALHQLIDEAADLVKKAENSKSRSDYNKALEKVSELPDCPEKDELSDRLETLDDIIDILEQNDGSNDKYDDTIADLIDENDELKEYIDDLEDDLDDLKETVEDIQNNQYDRELIKNIEDILDKAEKTKSPEDIQDAVNIIKIINNTNIIHDTETRTKYIERIEKLKEYAPSPISQSIVLMVSQSLLVNNTDNGPKIIAMDTQPYIENQRTLVPVRFVMEQLGAQVVWDGDRRAAIIVKGTDVIEFVQHSNIAKVNGKTIAMDVAVGVKNARTMIPLRFISETLGYKVDWNSQNGAIVITYSGTQSSTKIF